jgi:hypothetical protein
MPTQNPRWLDNEVQFARLIAEAEGLGLFTPDATKALCSEMDLSERDLMHLLGRAQKRFDRAKEEVLRGERHRTRRRIFT